MAGLISLFKNVPRLFKSLYINTISLAWEQVQKYILVSSFKQVHHPQLKVKNILQIIINIATVIVHIQKSMLNLNIIPGLGYYVVSWNVILLYQHLGVF